MIDTIRVVPLVDPVYTRVDEVQEPTRRVVRRWPEGVHQKNSIRIEASCVEVGRIGHTIDAGMLCSHESLRRSVKLQPSGGESRAVGEISVTHGLRDHGPAQR